MGWSVYTRNGMLTWPKARIDALSLHSDDPGLDGSNEVSHMDYERAAVVEADFDAPAAGEFVLNANQPYQGPPGGAVLFFGAWEGAEFIGGGSVVGDNAFNAEGVFVLKAGTAFNLNA